MENYIFDDKNTPEYLKISDDNKISLFSYIYIYERDDVYKRKIRKTIMENLKIKHYLKFYVLLHSTIKPTDKTKNINIPKINPILLSIITV